jgi:hypothetical protein
MKFRFVVALCFVVLAGAATAEPTWKIDEFSYFHVPGSRILQQMRQGAVPLEISPMEPGRWLVRLPKDRMGPSRLTASGFDLSVSVSDDGAGVFVREDGVLHGSLTVKLRVTGAIGGRPVDMPIAFSLTTRHAETAVSGDIAALDGVPLDPASGHVQLVAVGVSPAGSPTAGEPYYVVLSGRIEDLPAAMQQ